MHLVLHAKYLLLKLGSIQLQLGESRGLSSRRIELSLQLRAPLLEPLAPLPLQIQISFALLLLDIAESELRLGSLRCFFVERFRRIVLIQLRL